MTSVAARPALFCPIAGVHRDLGVAEDACAGRFTHNGVTLELGLPPDWRTAGLADDEEWLIECSKFLWGLDLAHAYAETGERRFRDAWALLVDSWIEQVSPRADATEVAARRLQNWVFARETFGGSPRLDERIADEVAWVRSSLTRARNHRTLELHGLLVAALGVPTLDPDGSLAEFALEELRANLDADFHPDGVHREASTHYHALVVRSLLSALENARRFGLEFGRRYEEQLARACTFLVHAHRPDGGLPALSDADANGHLELLDLAERLLDGFDTVPTARHASFPDGGYFVQRSGWDDDARFLIFDCGPLGEGGHGHYDALSFEAAADGARLVVDPGRYTYAEGEPNLRRWFKGTAAHNTVTVDGVDQTPYARGKPKGAVAKARAGARTTRPGLDVLRGEVRSPAYDALHTRTVLFVDDAYWIVEDRLEAGTGHHYDLRFHLAPGSVCINSVHADGARVTTPALALEIAGADAIAIETGWVSRSYGIRERAPVVSATHDGCQARFVTLLAPARTQVALRAVDPGRVVVETPRGHDVVSWTDGDAALRQEARR